MASTMFSGPSSLTPWLEDVVCDSLINSSTTTDTTTAKHPPKLVLMLTDGSLSDGTFRISVAWTTTTDKSHNELSTKPLTTQLCSSSSTSLSLPRKEHLPCMARISNWQVIVTGHVPQLQVNEFSIVGGHGIPPAKNLIHVCDTINVRRALQHYHYLNPEPIVPVTKQRQRQYQAVDQPVHKLGDVSSLLAPRKNVVEQLEKQVRQQEEYSWRYIVYSVDDRSKPVHVIDNMKDFHKVVSGVIAQYEKEHRQVVTRPPAVGIYRTQRQGLPQRRQLPTTTAAILQEALGTGLAPIEPKAMMMQEEILTDSEDDEIDVYKELGITKLLRLPSRDEMDEMALQDIQPTATAALLEEEDMDDDHDDMLATQAPFQIAPQVSEEVLPSVTDLVDERQEEEFHDSQSLTQLDNQIHQYLAERVPTMTNDTDDEFLSATQEEELELGAVHNDDDDSDEDWLTERPPLSNKRIMSSLGSATTSVWRSPKRTKRTMEHWQSYLIPHCANKPLAQKDKRGPSPRALGGDSIRALFQDATG